MNNYHNYIQRLCICVLVLLSYTVQAQPPIGDTPPEVKVIATATEDAILLRWAVTKPLAWKYANQYGYTIERTTIAIGDQILKDPVAQKITAMPILPKPMLEWETFSDTDTNAAIAAQAIYGSDFDVNMEQGGDDIMSIINQAQGLEQRFSFALFAADQSFEVAQFSGLAFVDTQVQPNERYLYRVYAAVPTEKLNIAYGGVYLGLADRKELPQPQDFVGIFNDKNALLSWNYTLLKKQYNNYIVERSADQGNSFTRLSELPIANLSEGAKDASDRMFYIDSLPQNNQEYQYRIRGISPFGMIGPPSDIVKGKGQKALLYNPAITHASLLPDNTNASITWEFPEEGIATVDHFELNRSNQVKGGYQVVISSIDKNQRSIQYDKLQAINYFTITAVGINGQKRVSFPKMIQPTDATPPSDPVNLTATIDSLGIVQLQWQQNTEADFLGYRVFRANLETEEFTQRTFRTIPKASYTDTVNIKTLNSKVYYKVQAFDTRYNPSGFSEVLMLQKPDIIPPTQPVFTSFKADKGVIALEWVTSSSEDALKTVVYRKEKGKDTPWALVAEVALPAASYQDQTATPGIPYLYTLLTMDASGLESPPVSPLTITLPDNAIKPAIDRFTATVQIEQKAIQLKWNYKAADVVSYTLYKASEEEQPTSYKIFEQGIGEFLDKNLTINTKYTYLLQAVFSSGAKSPFKKIEVEY